MLLVIFFSGCGSAEVTSSPPTAQPTQLPTAAATVAPSGMITVAPIAQTKTWTQDGMTITGTISYPNGPNTTPKFRLTVVGGDFVIAQGVFTDLPTAAYEWQEGILIDVTLVRSPNSSSSGASYDLYVTNDNSGNWDAHMPMPLCGQGMEKDCPTP